MSNDLLPDGWTRVKFGDVVSKVNDRVDPDTAGIERYVAGEHMDTDDLTIRRWGEVGDGYLGPAFHMRFKPGHVLYGSRRTYLRKVAVADFEGVTANTTFVLESSSRDLLPEFLPLVMTTEAFHEHSIKQSKGSVNPYINFSDLTWYEFALPPLDEQQRIAKLISSVDALEDRLTHMSESALTAQNAVAVVPSGEETACQRLGDLCEVLVGYPFKSADFVASGVRLARCSNVAPGFLRWDEKATVYLSAEDAENHLQFNLRAGDILIAMDGTFTAEGFKAAEVKVSDTPSLLVQRVARLRAVDGGLSAAALLVVVRSSAFRRWLLGGTTQTTVAHVSSRLICDFPIPSDWRECESAVAGSHLKSIDEVSASVANQRAQTQVLRKALLEKLLFGNVDHVH